MVHVDEFQSGQDDNENEGTAEGTDGENNINTSSINQSKKNAAIKKQREKEYENYWKRKEKSRKKYTDVDIANAYYSVQSSTDKTEKILPAASRGEIVTLSTFLGVLLNASHQF